MTEGQVAREKGDDYRTWREFNGHLISADGKYSYKMQAEHIELILTAIACQSRVADAEKAHHILAGGIADERDKNRALSTRVAEIEGASPIWIAVDDYDSAMRRAATSEQQVTKLTEALRELSRQAKALLGQRAK